MDYIVGEKTDDFAELGANHASYRDYLLRNETCLKESGLSCLLADWYYDWSDKCCLHDSWLEKLTFNRLLGRGCKVSLELLGAYHDKRLILIYEGVQSYDMPSISSENWEWDLDEIEVIEPGIFKHKILWTSGEKWEFLFSGKFEYKCLDINSCRQQQ